MRLRNKKVDFTALVCFNIDKYTIWNFEWVLDTPVKGDFTIEVVNNCPSGGSTSKNLDRMTILDLIWYSAV